MKVNILGSEWEIELRSVHEDKELEAGDGYCDWTVKLIVVEKECEGTLYDMDEYVRKVMRHEIVHAYLFECGLAECSGRTDSWAQNETMVDWLARNGPKIMKTWEEAGCLPKEADHD